VRRFLGFAIVAVLALPGAGAARPEAGAGASPSVFVAPTGSDSGPCTQAAPCRSFDRAYHVASPGDVVSIAPGSYPAQTITDDPSKDAPAVLFEPQRPGSVQVVGLMIQASHVEVDGLTFTRSWYVGVNSNTVAQSAQPHDVVLRDLRAPVFFITAASDVSVIGGSYGPEVDQAAQIKGCYECRYAPSDILVDGVTFHDFTRATKGTHMECLHVYPAQGLTIRNSRFLNCAIMDVFLSNYGAGGDLRDITIENNVFDTPGSHAGALSKGYYGLAFGGFNRTITNVRIAYNSMLTASIPGFDSSATYTNVDVEANVGALDPRFCSKGVTYAYNVWTAAKCGATDTTAPSGFADPAQYDFEPTATAATIGHGDPRDHPATDIDGRLRPSRLAPDAGAYQRETALIVLGKSIGAATIGESTSRIAAFYGRASSSRRVRLAGRALLRQTYRIHGGELWVTAAQGRVVGVATSSPYYETAGTLGPGAAVARVRRLSRVTWSGCNGAYRRDYRGAHVYFAPKGGRRGATIGTVSILAPAASCR